jgi:hypothetical protein
MGGNGEADSPRRSGDDRGPSHYITRFASVEYHVAHVGDQPRT